MNNKFSNSIKKKLSCLNLTQTVLPRKSDNSEKGAALVVALLVLALLTGFVALTISKTSTETVTTNMEVLEAKTYMVSEGSLDATTRDLVDLFESKLNPLASEIDAVQNKRISGFDNYDFTTEINKTDDVRTVTLSGGDYAGLMAIRDSWEIQTRATHKNSDTKVEVRRRFFNDKIPIYQFAAFYEKDLEISPWPKFYINGRVHTNANLWIAGVVNEANYSSKITAVGEIVNDIYMSSVSTSLQNLNFINDLSGSPQELIGGEASVICTSTSGPNVFASNPNLPYCMKNSNWNAHKQKFQGNLENNVKPLRLPLDENPIEIIKAGKTIGDMYSNGGTLAKVDATSQDSLNLMRQRFANKPGLRVSLADAQNLLPGCANATADTSCGVRLDGALGTSIGYQPVSMTDGYKTTALNATRMAVSGREIWIKVELVDFPPTVTAPLTKDVTQDMLSLGITEQAPIGSDLAIQDYSSTTDSRSVIKLQRFSIKGNAIPKAGNETSRISNYTLGGTSHNLVVRYQDVGSEPSVSCPGSCTPADEFTPPFPSLNASTQANQGNEDQSHLKWADIKGSGYKYAIVPFPIKMFDTREGHPNGHTPTLKNKFGSSLIPAAGAISLIDIDVANLRKFLQGDFDGAFPTNTPFATAKGSSLRSTDVPELAGWVLYVSDRRGDYDFDGEYDMEDVVPDGVLGINEDANENGVLDTDYLKEAPAYDTSVPTSQAATADHLYYRRGVRLINGSRLPGKYVADDPEKTQGFTVVTENGIYTLGNYNATGVILTGEEGSTPSENYLPQNTANHIPAAILADAVTILSNQWTDGRMFAHPFDNLMRPPTQTTVRFAMISGLTPTGKGYYSVEGNSYHMLSGTLINIKRTLEDWQGIRLNYSGSLINLFNSRNFNATWNSHYARYRAPLRDWTFESTFLDKNRLPPGTPFAHSISFTGFERVGR